MCSTDYNYGKKYDPGGVDEQWMHGINCGEKGIFFSFTTIKERRPWRNEEKKAK